MTHTTLLQNPDYHAYVVRATEARAEALERFGHAAVRAVHATARIAADLARAVARGHRLRRRRREGIAVLSALDDRMLADIGIDRAGIEAVVDAYNW